MLFITLIYIPIYLFVCFNKFMGFFCHSAYHRVILVFCDDIITLNLPHSFTILVKCNSFLSNLIVSVIISIIQLSAKCKRSIYFKVKKNQGTSKWSVKTTSPSRFHLSLSVCLSVCLSVYLSACLPACLSICLSISIYLSKHI